jgi:glyoxylase-like metal-dependent hydrolase (beta-lactamase superfamily II)
VDGLLVDSGCSFTDGELLRALPPDRRPVTTIVNTHCHEDHIGANGLLQQRLGSRIHAHPLALPVLDNPHLQPLQPYRRVFWGWPRPSRGEPANEWIETEHHRLRVIPTPGHSPDHIALYEPQRGWLFSGDAYIGGRDKAARGDYDVRSIIRSLRTLAALDITALFPGSGTVRQNHPADEILRKADQMEELGAQIHALHASGCDSTEIRNRLFGRETSLYFVTLGHFSGIHLVEIYLRAAPDSSGPASTPVRFSGGGGAG